MTTTTFDTHEVYQSIKKAGLTDQQADGIYEAIKIAHTSSELATKSDIKALELLTKADIKELEYKIELLRSETKKDIAILRKEIAESKNQLIRWMGGIAILGASYVTWLIEYHGKL